MKYEKKIIALTFVILILALAVWYGRGQPTSEAVAPVPLVSYLSDPAVEGFSSATEPNAVQFPRDLGAHEDFQTEWWYYTGQVQTADGRPFGYQFTLFRRALTPPAAVPPSSSAWRSNQLYFAHFALSDVENGQFYATERFSRGAAGLAGAQADPYHIWIEDWQVQTRPDGTQQMTAEHNGVAINFTLTQTRPPVLHGQGGLSFKGENHASYYYSLVNIQTAGQITIGEEQFEVQGQSWKDHEYSTQALDEGTAGWDWFSLHLDNPDQNALMLFQIRQTDGGLEPKSAGSWILPDSSTEEISLAEMQIEVLEWWVSPVTNVRYPAGWRITIPKLELELTGYPLMPNQELHLATTYWEGAVQFTGTLQGQPVTAGGYVEMTGYELESGK